MTVEIPQADYIVDLKDGMEVEEMLKKAGLDIKFAEKSSTVRIGTIRILVFESIGAAIMAIAAVLIAEALIRAITSYQTPRQRRRLRTQLCVKECLAILMAAQKTVAEGYGYNRALKTSDKEKRKNRSFKSKA